MLIIESSRYLLCPADLVGAFFVRTDDIRKNFRHSLGYDKGRLSIAAPNRTYSQKRSGNSPAPSVYANTPQLLVFPNQHRHTLHMHRMREHVHRRNLHRLEPAVLQDAQIAGQGRWITGHIHHTLWSHLQNRIQKS